MRLSRISTVLVFGAVVAGMVFTGCAPGEKKLAAAEAKIADLSAKGVSDSILSSAKVFLMQTRNFKRTGNGTYARNNADSLFATIKNAEAWLAMTTSTVKPFIDSVRAVIAERKKGLTGFNLKDADSLLSVVDTKIAKNLLPEAKVLILELDAYMPTLLADEQKSVEFRKMIVGTWRGEFEPEQKGMTAIKKQVISFKDDGNFSMDESMKGQSSENLKEDWQFQSSGTYGIKGDTVLLSVLKEKCLKQEYQRQVNGKWVTDKMKTYDTTITNGSKDQFIVRSFLNENFKKK